MRGLDPRIYTLRRPDVVGAPGRVDPRNKSAGDEMWAGDETGATTLGRRDGGGAPPKTVMRVLDTRTYPFGRPVGVEAPERVGPRNKSAGDETEVAGDETEVARPQTVMRVLDTRTYPSGRRHGWRHPAMAKPGKFL